MFPRGALLYLTDACYMNCKHCGIVNNNNPTYLSDENFNRCIDFLKNKKCYIVAISGGDPLMHPKLFEYIKDIRKAGMLPVLGISGVEVSGKDIELIKNANIGCIQLSIDGYNEKTNSLYRDEGSFKKILINYKKLKKVGIRVNVALCLSKENINEFEKMLIFLKTIEPYQIKIQFWEQTNQNNIFTELSSDEKKEVCKKTQLFMKMNNLDEWANIAIESKEDMKDYKKFIMYPNGNVKDGEASEFIGNIITDVERISEYYE